MYGGLPADGGDEIEGLNVNTPPTYCTLQSAALGMGCTAGGSEMTSCQARSEHPNGVNECMCDGAVRFISNSIDQVNWCRLSSKSDGQIVTYPY